jgi:hypothetical protein
VNVEWARLTWPIILTMATLIAAAGVFGGWPWLLGAIAAAAISTLAIITDDDRDNGS